jgi:hypothetical protein
MKSCAVYVAYRRGSVYLSLVHMLLLIFSTQDMNYQGSTCICRVPKSQVRTGTVVECVHCGNYHEFLVPPIDIENQFQVAADAALTRSTSSYMDCTVPSVSLSSYDVFRVTCGQRYSGLSSFLMHVPFHVTTTTSSCSLQTIKYPN